MLVFNAGMWMLLLLFVLLDVLEPPPLTLHELSLPRLIASPAAVNPFFNSLLSGKISFESQNLGFNGYFYHND